MSVKTTHPVNSDTPTHPFEPVRRKKTRAWLESNHPDLKSEFVRAFVRFLFARKAAKKGRKNAALRFRSLQTGRRLEGLRSKSGRRYEQQDQLVDRHIFELLTRPEVTTTFGSKSAAFRQLQIELKKAGLDMKDGRARSLNSLERRVSRLVADICLPDPLTRGVGGAKTIPREFEVKPIPPEHGKNQE